MVARCRNCDAVLHGEYCSACGQRDFEPRRPLWQLLRELLVETFELDGRLGRTLVPFLRRPGFLSREFREGRRARYTSPLRLYIATSLLCFSVLAVRGCVGGDPLDGAGPMLRRDDVVDGEVVPGDADAPIETGDGVVIRMFRTLRDKSREFASMPADEQRRRAYAGMTSNFPKLLFVLVPVFALILRVLFRRRHGFLYVDHLVLALHVHSLWFLGIAVGVFLPEVVDSLVSIGMMVYGVLALRGAYGLSWPATLWRSAVVAFVYGIALVLALMAAFLLAVLGA